LPNTGPVQFVQNLRFLLWSKGFHSVAWASELQALAGLNEGEAWALLLGSKPASESAVKRIASRFQVEPEDLLYADLLGSAKVNVVRANLKMLMKDFGSGQKKLLAQRLKVHPGTISRWLGGTQAPDRKTLQYLASHFELKAGTDLATEPLFLSPHPVSDSERREWLLRKTREIDSASLSELFPALVRMLGGSRQ
jgi:transcriptional regulator with XRE-family HTH domain